MHHATTWRCACAPWFFSCRSQREARTFPPEPSREWEEHSPGAGPIAPGARRGDAPGAGAATGAAGGRGPRERDARAAGAGEGGGGVPAGGRQPPPPPGRKEQPHPTGGLGRKEYGHGGKAGKDGGSEAGGREQEGEEGNTQGGRAGPRRGANRGKTTTPKEEGGHPTRGMWVLSRCHFGVKEGKEEGRGRKCNVGLP